MASSRQPDDGTAPTYTIPRRSLGALEHPLIIKNLDKGIKTFGQNNAFRSVSPSFPIEHDSSKLANGTPLRSWTLPVLRSQSPCICDTTTRPRGR